MSATDKQLCEFMQYNQWKQPDCLAQPSVEGKSAACLFPRYCGADSTWYHSQGWQKCVFRMKQMHSDDKEKRS